MRHVELFGLMLAIGTVSPVASQIDVHARVTAVTDLVARAIGNTNLLPAGTVLTDGTRVSALAVQSPCSASAAASVAIADGSPNATVRFENQALAIVDPFVCSASGSTGPHTIRIELSAGQSVTGRLLVTTDPASFLNSYTVDVGDDGDIELTPGFGPNTGLLDMPVTIGVTPLNIAVTASVTSPGLPVVPIVWTMNVEVAFEPNAGRVESIGTPCGPELSGLFRRDPARGEELEFRVSNSAVTPFAFYVVGTSPLSLPIPPVGCLLRTNLLVFLPTTVAAGGTAGLTVPVPPSIGRADFRLQYLAATLDPAGNPIWRSSEALRVKWP